MSDLHAQVRKHKGGHYFTVFAGITPIVSGETKDGAIVLPAPLDADVVEKIEAIVRPEIEAVDEEHARHAAEAPARAAKNRPAMEETIARLGKLAPADMTEEAKKQLAHARRFMARWFPAKERDDEPTTKTTSAAPKKKAGK